MQLTAASYGLPPNPLAAVVSHTGQPVTVTNGNVEVFPRTSAAQFVWLQERIASTDLDRLSEIWPSIEAGAVAAPKISDPIRVQASELARKRLETKDFGLFGAEILRAHPAIRLALLRDALLPEFFRAHPGGQVLVVKFADQFNSQIALLSNLRRAKLFPSTGIAQLRSMAGQVSMSAFGLNIPSNLLYQLLQFGLSFSWPNIQGFVIVAELKFFLVFLFEKPVELEKPRIGQLGMTTPTAYTVLDSRVQLHRIELAKAWTRTRTYPFYGRQYNVDQIFAFIQKYLASLDGFLRWLSDLTNFVDASGEVNIDFAYESYLTVYVLLATMFRLIESEDAFARKSDFFTCVELLAGLIDSSNSSSQASAWSALLRPDHRELVVSALQKFGGVVGADMMRAVRDIWKQNRKTVESGVLFDLLRNGVVQVGSKAIPIEDYEIRLLRAMRNTQHGFHTTNAPLLSTHSGSISNDLPDYALALFIALIVDQHPYSLKH